MTGIHPTKTVDPEAITGAPFPDLREARSYSHFDLIKYLSMAVSASTVLVISRVLKPASRGFGTHEQLGLPPCPFLYLTGIPCPSCGLTTSFAYAARLKFSAALITQPFGLIAFCLTILSIPLSIYLIRRRISWAEFFHSRNLDALIYALIGIYLLSWVYKVVAMKWLFAGN